MSVGLEKLQKEIDALTYNSRTVLNALISSTVVNGSSQGFKVTRVTETITLSRVDIYRLYRFYQEWEENQFSTEDVAGTISQKKLKSFDTIREEHDTRSVVDSDGVSVTSATSGALVKHSQILYLNESNIDLITIDLHWLGLIEDANNPKLISNSSPIPINLRTPVFDANLATTRYNQHPTYLFPTAYYILDAFGYSGDDTDHRMDGNSWTIGADEYISIESPNISMGGVDSRDTRKTIDTRNGPDGRSNYSTAWGYNTYARGLYSTAGGKGSVVSESAIAAVSIGDSNLSSGSYSATIGGVSNTAVGNYIGVFSGIRNTIIGNGGGTIGGTDNIVGAPVHSFTFPSDNLSSTDCVVSVDDCAAELAISGGSIFGRNQIAISGDYSSLYDINDVVRLFKFTSAYDSESGIEFNQANGEIFDTQEVNVTAVEYVDPEINPDNLNVGMTIISLSSDVNGIGIVDGGSVSVTTNSSRSISYGANSTAFGSSLIAQGADQTVVGHYNYVSVTSRFLVGTGTSSNRGSGFSVYDTGFQLAATPFNDTMRNGIDGYYGIEGSTSKMDVVAGDSSMRLSDSRNFIGYNYGESTWYGCGIYGEAYDYDVILQGSTKSVLIRSSSDDSLTPSLYAGDIAIYAENSNHFVSNDVTTLISNNNYISIQSGADLKLNWDSQLSLSGDTFGALPTTDSQFAFIVDSTTVSGFTVDGSTTGSAIGKTGFYYIDSELDISSTFRGIGTYGDDKSILNTVISSENSSGDIEGWELYSSTYSSDSLNGSGKVYANKFHVIDNIYSSYTPKAFAWDDDIKDMGVWYDGSSLIPGIVIGNLGSLIDDSTKISEIVEELMYTIVNDRIDIQLIIDIDKLNEYYTSYFISDSHTVITVGFDLGREFYDTNSNTLTYHKGNAALATPVEGVSYYAVGVSDAIIINCSYFGTYTDVISDLVGNKIVCSFTTRLVS